jgi:hypothetical protein
MFGIILPLCRIAGLVFGLLAAYYWFRASRAKVTDKDTRYDPRFDFVVNDPEGKGRDTKKLTFGQSPIITVIGKAFWDVGHAPKDQGNRRKYMPDYAEWEIHPVMKLTVQ